MTIITNSVDETAKLGIEFVKTLKPGSVIGLIGELGGGKTSFVKGMAMGIGVKQKRLVRSPSFTIINEYEGKIPLYHFDLYRLKSASELIDMGVDDYIYGNGICIIEWADRFNDLWPKNITYVKFQIISENSRSIEFFDNVSKME